MKIVLKMTALEPISVGFESIGIETLIYKIPIVKENGEVLDVPIIPGNSLRGILRDEMTMQFIEDVLAQKSDIQFHIGSLISMFSGGVLGKEKQSEITGTNIKNIMDNYVKYLLPLSIMGVALKKIMIPSKIKVGIAYPLTEETKELIEDLIDRKEDNSELPKLKDIESSMLMTRKNDETKIRQLDIDIVGETEEFTGEDTKVQQRFFRQVVIPGTIFYSYVEEIIPLTDYEKGLLIKSIERLTKVGGSSVRGLGKVKVEIIGIDNNSKEGYIQKYKEFIQDNIDNIAKALQKDPVKDDISSPK